MNTDTNDVLVTGLGPVASIGVGNDALWSMLAEGRTQIHRRTLPVDVGQSVELPLASMPPTPDVPGLGKHMDFLTGQGCAGYRDLGYALLAMELALADAGVERRAAPALTTEQQRQWVQRQARGMRILRGPEELRLPNGAPVWYLQTQFGDVVADLHVWFSDRDVVVLTGRMRGNRVKAYRKVFSAMAASLVRVE